MFFLTPSTSFGILQKLQGGPGSTIQILECGGDMSPPPSGGRHMGADRDWIGGGSGDVHMI